MDILKKISIGLSMPDVHDKIKSVIRILDSENLLTMANGDRLKWIFACFCGNRRRSWGVSQKKDDIHLYEYDSKRLTSLLLFAFYKSINHLHPTTFSLGDNLKMFSSVIEKQTKDAHRCQADMMNLGSAHRPTPFARIFRNSRSCWTS